MLLQNLHGSCCRGTLTPTLRKVLKLTLKSRCLNPMYRASRNFPKRFWTRTISAPGRVLLAFAAHNGADDLVELLLEYNADPDPINQYGVRRICLAALDGHEAVVRMLLDKKVDPNQVEGSSKAPLSWAPERRLDAYR